MLPQIIIYINVLRKSWSIKTHLLSYKSLALLFLEVSSLHIFFFILNRKLNMHSSKLEVAGQKCLSLVKDSGTILNTVNKFKWSLVMSISIALSEILNYVSYLIYWTLSTSCHKPKKEHFDSDASSTNPYFLKKC